MILLDVEGVRKHFGPEPVLDGVTFQVRPGDRIGLVGPNGCGKTTLLRILAGLDEPEAGACRLHASARLGFLEQQAAPAPGRSLYDVAAEGLADLYALQEEALGVAAAMAESDPDEQRRLAARYDHLQHELERREAFNVEHRVRRVLEGLGFAVECFDQPAETLSGGERSRLMLARLLLSEPNLMLLDEPSNHLDIASTEWLEAFLVESSAAMLLVSHDRRFLDKVARRVVELFRGTVEQYAGNYAAYRRQKAERVLVQRRAYERQRAEIAKAEEFIRRNAYGQKHAQAEDRRKKLARIEPVPPPRDIPVPPITFPAARRAGDVVLRAQSLSKRFDRPLFAELSFEILRGQRWAVLGPNGSGKTTLVGCLLGQVEPDEGRARLGHQVAVGYYDQRLARFDDAMTVVDAVRPADRIIEEPQRRSLLARFGLTGDIVFQPVGSLSGGERCRLALARLSAAEANFLVLDEPTNHLDLWAREALEEALRQFDGAVLLVSHDRQFINRVADHLIVLESGRARVVEGDYDMYRRLAAAEGAGSDDRAKPQAVAKPQAGAKPQAARRVRRFPYRKLADLEAEILDHENRIDELHRLLCDGRTQRDGQRVRQFRAEIEEHQARLAGLYEHWEEAADLDG
jgi:ATP-binding cassette, subfamily F, member 3